MSNINSQGIDATSGQQRPVSSTDTLLVIGHISCPQGPGLQTSERFGAQAETVVRTGGSNSLAVGFQTIASDYGVAIGYQANADTNNALKSQATAIGSNAVATEDRTTAVGASSSATGLHGCVYGWNANDGGFTDALVFGNITATGGDSVSIGGPAGLQAVSIGSTSTGAKLTVALGFNAQAPHANSGDVSLGSNCTAGNASQIVFPAANASFDNLAIGDTCEAGIGTGICTNNIAIGGFASIGSYGGTGNTKNYSDCIAIGDAAQAGASGWNASVCIAIGVGLSATGIHDCIAVGNGCTAGNTATDHDIIAIGDGCSGQNGINIIAIGNGASVSGFNDGTAIGRAATCTGSTSVAIGTLASAAANEVSLLNGNFNFKVGTGTGIQFGASNTTKMSWWGASPSAQLTVTGSRGGNAALASLLTQLATIGLIVDGTSA